LLGLEYNDETEWQAIALQSLLPLQIISNLLFLRHMLTSYQKKWLVVVSVTVLTLIIIGTLTYFSSQQTQKNNEAKRQATNASSSSESTSNALSSSSAVSSYKPEPVLPFSSSSTVSSVSGFQIYFSKDPSSFDDPSIVVGVARTPGAAQQVGYPMDALTAGPTEQEKTQGLFTPFKFVGSSNCDGLNYFIEISGSKGKLTFCRAVEEVTNTPGAAGNTFKAQQRVLKVIVTSYVGKYGITQMEIRNNQGNCYGKDADSLNLNSCS
jgi:hypothetical protein